VSYIAAADAAAFGDAGAHRLVSAYGKRWTGLFAAYEAAAATGSPRQRQLDWRV
jgi:hypothetical protein